MSFACNPLFKSRVFGVFCALALVSLGISLAGCQTPDLSQLQDQNNTDSDDQNPVVVQPTPTPTLSANPYKRYYIAYHGSNASSPNYFGWLCTTEFGSYIYRLYCEDTSSAQQPPHSFWGQPQTIWEAIPSINGTHILRRVDQWRKMWSAVQSGLEYHLAVQDYGVVPTVEQLQDPNFYEHNRFIFHEVGTGTYGEKLMSIESSKFPNKYVDPIGHSMTANGVSLTNSASTWNFFETSESP